MIFYFYLFLSVFALLNPTNIGIDYLIVPIILMWLLFFIFYKNAKSGSVISQNLIPILETNSYKILSIFITLFAIIFIPLYTQYYTGSNLFTSIVNFFSGASQVNSTYVQYQRYFSQMQLGQFTIEKIPFIVGFGVLKFLFWSVIFRTIVFKRKINKFDISIMTILFFLFFFIGVARGTSFEIFELIIILAFSTLLRFKRLYNKNWYSFKITLIMVTLMFLSFNFFLFSKSLRFGGQNLISKPTFELSYNYDSLISIISPPVSIAFQNLTGYFLFGLYFTGISIAAVTQTITGVLSLFIPFGLNVMGIGTDFKSLICGHVIDCGASWIPDVMQIMGSIGLIFLILIVRYLGKTSKKLYVELMKGNILASILLYTIFLFFISLPIGNFISVSSSNQIAILLTLILYLLPNKTYLYGFFVVK